MNIRPWEQYEYGKGRDGKPTSWRMVGNGISVPAEGGLILNGLIVSTNAILHDVRHITFRATFYQGGKDPVHGGGGDQASEHACVRFNGKDIYKSRSMNGSLITHDTGTQVLVGWKIGEPLWLLMYGTENGHWPVNYPCDLYRHNNTFVVDFYNYIP